MKDKSGASRADTLDSLLISVLVNGKSGIDPVSTDAGARRHDLGHLGFKKKEAFPPLRLSIGELSASLICKRELCGLLVMSIRIARELRKSMKPCTFSLR